MKKNQEKLIWQQLEGASPKECGKLVKQMLKLKIDKDKIYKGRKNS